MHGVIVVCIIIFLLSKWFFWKLETVALIHYMTKNNIEINNEQLRESLKAVLRHWFKQDRKMR